eukprot:SAG22_NODE_897_length_6629_cov_4.853446_2_plen_165_part_00
MLLCCWPLCLSADFKKIETFREITRDRWVDGLSPAALARCSLDDPELEDLGNGRRRPKAGWTTIVYSSPDFELCRSLFQFKLVKKMRVELRYDEMSGADVSDMSRSHGIKILASDPDETDGDAHHSAKYLSFDVFLCHQGDAAALAPGGFKFKFDLEVRAGRDL